MNLSLDITKAEKKEDIYKMRGYVLKRGGKSHIVGDYLCNTYIDHMLISSVNIDGVGAEVISRMFPTDPYIQNCE